VVGTAGVLAVRLLYYATSAMTEEVAFRGYLFQNLLATRPNPG
jgi:hypothetical protein